MRHNPSGTAEVLDRLASDAMKPSSNSPALYRSAPRTSRALATLVVGEILAHSLAISDAAFVAEITNAVLAEHELAWRLVTVS